MSSRRRREPVAFAFRIVLYVIYAVPLLWIVLTSLKSQGEVLGSQASIIFTPTLDAYRKRSPTRHSGDSMRQSAIISIGTTAGVSAVRDPGRLRARPSAHQDRRHRARDARDPADDPADGQPDPAVLAARPVGAARHQSWASSSPTPCSSCRGRSCCCDPSSRRSRSSIEEASRIDGARTLRAFFSVALPLARNGVFTVTAIVFLVSWGEFLYGITFMLSPENYPMSALIAVQAGAYGIDWPAMMAFAVISAVPVFIVYIFSYRLLRTGLTMGAVK